jgi:prepilin-type N-terminal cleavage/methylation domain-containing protein
MFSSVRSRSGTLTNDGTRSDKGFTLVELLIVIVVLGILATITVFAVSGITSKASKSACSADVSSLTTAIEAFNAGQGNYPPGPSPAQLVTQLMAVQTDGAQYLRIGPATAKGTPAVERFVYVPATGALTASAVAGAC